MNFIDQSISDLFSTRSATGSSESGLAGGFPWFGWGGGSKNARPINTKKALTVSAVWSACDTISSAVAVVPFGVYKKIDGGRDRMDDHAVDWLLNQEPDGENGWLTPFTFKKMMLMSLLLRGNCLFEYVMQGNGEMLLNYIAWDDVTDIKKIQYTNGDKTLQYFIKGGKTLFSEDVLHLRGLSLDGITGLGFITYACLTLNIAIEVQEFSYVNFESKGVRQGVIESDKVIGGPMGPAPRPAAVPGNVPAAAPGAEAVPKANTDGGKRAIVAGWRSALAERSPDRVVVLDEGMKYKPIMMTAQEAQIIEQQKLTNEDIARFLNIAPHKIKALERSTNNNIEHQAIEFVTDTIQPWVTNIEQEFGKRLLTRKERKAGVFIRGNMNVLLRGDMQKRAEFYAKMLNGIMTSNEIRALEEMNPKDGGDELRFQVNTQTQEQIDNSQKDE